MSVVIAGVMAVATTVIVHDLAAWWDARRIARETGRAMRRDLGHFCNLFALGLGAGDEPLRLLPMVTQRLVPGRLRACFEQLQHQIAHGRSLRDAIKTAMCDLDEPSVRRFFILLDQGVQYGAPLAALVTAHAQSLRVQRLAAIDREGALLGEKLLFPIVFTILPAYFLLIVGSVVLSLLERFG
jgi:Flp pilus assembly protein TadB